MIDFIITIDRWFKASINVFIHWASFGAIASLLPFLVFIDLTNESATTGIYRVLREATLSGDLIIAMIPLMGGLIGETVIRTFKVHFLEIFSSIVGICIFVLLISFALDHQNTNTETLTPEQSKIIIENTTMLAYMMFSYALAVMFTSSTKKVSYER